jgi:hypothetical protein
VRPYARCAEAELESDVTDRCVRTLVLSGMLFAVPADAASLRVAANGVDAPGCGAASAPCRTIARGIQEANAGASIVVGPGFYEEPVVTCGDTQAFVCIDKPVRLTSTDGAASTVIHGEAVGPLPDGVVITASGVTLGTPKHGFTIRSSGGNVGVRAEGAAARVAGNLLIGNLEGVQIIGDGAIVERNVALLNGVGFGASGDRAALRNLTALGNGRGFSLRVLGSEHPSLSRSASVANEQAGIAIDASGAGGAVTIERSSVIGNASGIAVEGVGSPVRIAASNLYGSGDSCALDLAADVSVDAPTSFWGAPGGPGAAPADAVCTEAGAEAATSPPAPRPFRIEGAGALP